MNQCRRTTLALLALMAAAFGAAHAPSLARQNGISVTVDGDPLTFAGTGPQMVDGRVLVPLRGIFERLGAHVQWDPGQQQVTATRGNDTVQLQIGNPNATVDGSPVTLDVPAKIVNGSTMVPIRFVSESLGAQVSWREAEQMVVIVSNQQAAPPPPSAPAGPPGDGPIRMARIAWSDGGVTWRPGDDVDWSDAAINLPLREGAEIWVNPGSRAEIQFDDGSVVRLGNGAVAILQTMFSDNEGEFTEIRLNSGTATLRLTNQLSMYQVDTPLASVKAFGPGSLRVDDTDGLRLAVRSGEAQAQGVAGQITLEGGQFLSLRDGNSPYRVSNMPPRDGWDQYWDRRDAMFQHPSPYLPSSLALVGYDLDSYGVWVNDPQYGHVWRPRVSDPNWGPYRQGHWVWVSPFGWTWCAAEPWGWAPYHYGTWLQTGGGWAWSPGPAQQYWSPAVVHFSTYNGVIAWAPLAPAEVRYPPTLSIGFQSGNWAVNFSIGGAACYYPSGSSYCEPRPWSNTTVNRTTNVYNVTNITNVTNVYASNNGFVPRNSRIAGGASTSPVSEFGHAGGANHPAPPNADIFVKGKTFAAPTGGTVRYAGPTNVRPTASSFAPTHSFSASKPSASALSRPVVRASLPPSAASVAKPMPNTRVVATAPARTNPTRSNPGTNPRLTSTPSGTGPRRNPNRRISPTRGMTSPVTNPRTSTTNRNPGRPPVTSMPSRTAGRTPATSTTTAPKAKPTTPPVKASKPAPKDKKGDHKHDKKPGG